MTRAGRLQFIMLVCVFLGFVAVGRPFVVLWAKGDASFAIDYPVAILLFLSTIMSSIQFVGLEILRAKGMHKFRAWVYLAAAGVNVVLMIPCAGSGVCWALPAASLSSHCWETSCPSTGTTAKGSGWM